MHMHADATTGANKITAYGPGYFVVSETRIESSIVVTPSDEVQAWPPVAWSDIDEESFDLLESLEVEILLLGTGNEHRFAEPGILAQLHRRGIGVEVMTTSAACRTYNVLVAEGRRVAALLIAIEA